MDHDQFDILDREDRIFKSFQATIDLMEGSHSKEVRDTQVLLSFLADEYSACRKSLRATIKHARVVEVPASSAAN